jgi:co-chaperonin GroES (HSP10)
MTSQLRSMDDRNEILDKPYEVDQHLGEQSRPQLTDSSVGSFDVGSIKFWAVGDRVLIEEDEFRTGFECASCEGKRKINCNNCAGTGVVSHGGPTLKCSACDGEGKITCATCQGKGALIIAPETAERRPTSGKVISAGPRCTMLKPGDAVLYSNFAGYVVDLARAGKPITMRILHETEVLARMEGHLTLANLKGKSDISFPTI